MDTLRNLLNNDPTKLEQHILVDEEGVDAYLMNGWKWKEGRYDIQKSLRDLVDSLNQVCAHHRSCICARLNVSNLQEMASIDNTLKAKLNNYNLVKGSLTQMQRKKTSVV